MLVNALALKVIVAGSLSAFVILIMLCVKVRGLKLQIAKDAKRYGPAKRLGALIKKRRAILASLEEKHGTLDAEFTAYAKHFTDVKFLGDDLIFSEECRRTSAA